MNQRRIGAILSYVSLGSSMVIQFCFIPILFHYLTKNEYGLYQLIGSLIAYMTIMDFGLSATIVRYYSKYTTFDDVIGKENVLALFLILYGVISFFSVIAGMGLYASIDIIYKMILSPIELLAAKDMFLILLLNIIITIPSNVFSAVIIAHEKFIFQRVVSIMQTCLKPIVVLAVFNWQASAINLVIIDTIFNLFIILCNAFYCFRKLNLKIKFHFWDKNLMCEVVSFALFVFLNAVVDQVYWKTSQLVLGAFIGTSAVAVYAIAIQLDMAFMSFSTGISNVFLPKLSVIVDTTKDMTIINELFVKIGRLQYFVLALICSGFGLYGKQFIYLWVGAGFEEAYDIALLIMIALMIPLVQNLGVSILQALNKHAFRSKLYVIIAILNFIISIPLAKQYGGFGCAMATSGALLLGNGLIINIYYYKVIGLNVIKFFKEILKLTVVVFGVVLIAYSMERFFSFPSFPWLVGKVILYITGYGVAMWHFGMNEYEKSLFLMVLPRKGRRTMS